MSKVFVVICCFLMCGCTFPTTPQDGDLLNATHQFQPEMFNSGARGVVVVSLSDNVSKNGWFGRKYIDAMAFKNLQSGEAFFLSTQMGNKEYDTAMLTIGEYEVTNLYMQYIYTTTSQVGNQTITTTHIETDEHYENDDKIRFFVKPGQVSYIGNIKLVRSENEVRSDGKKVPNTFKIEDKSADIPVKQQKKWLKQFGTDYVVDIMHVK